MPAKNDHYLFHGPHRSVDVWRRCHVIELSVCEDVGVQERPLDGTRRLGVLAERRVLSVPLGSSLMLKQPRLEYPDVEHTPIDLARGLLESPARVLCLVYLGVIPPRLPFHRLHRRLHQLVGENGDALVTSLILAILRVPANETCVVVDGTPRKGRVLSVLDNSPLIHEDMDNRRASCTSSTSSTRVVHVCHDGAWNKKYRFFNCYIIDVEHYRVY